MQPQSLEEVSEKRWVVCDSYQEVRKRAAISLEGQFSRVYGLSHPGKTYEREVQLLNGEWRDPRRTVAYMLKNATLIGSYVYCGRHKITLDKCSEKLFSAQEVQRYTEGSLGCTITGNRFFSHWMTDNLTLELAGRDMSVPVVVTECNFGHAAGYRELLNLDIEVGRVAKFESLIVFDDVAQNDYKRERYLELRSRLAALVQVPTEHPGAIILRGRSGRLRLLENELKVAEHLEKKYGFRVIDPSVMSPFEIVSAVQGCEIVLGVEGSAMAHGLFSVKDRGVVFILQPPMRFNALYKEYTDCIGLDLAYLVGAPTGKSGFVIDLDELDRTLELVSNRDQARH